MCYINIIGLAVVKTSLVEKEEEKKNRTKNLYFKDSREKG